MLFGKLPVIKEQLGKISNTKVWEVRCDHGTAMREGGSEREYSVDLADINWIEGGSVDGRVQDRASLLDALCSADFNIPSR
jgi:hypothetical protein